MQHMVQTELWQTQQLEMRRGTIVLVILSQLDRPRYGYDLLQTLEHAAFIIDAGTLYPLLRRLEKQGLLESSWETSETRPRKYYRRSEAGERFYQRLREEWIEMTKAINEMIKE